MAQITIEQFSFTYPEQEKKALDQINCSIEQGQWVLLCGASASGKTTLLKHLKKELNPVGKKQGLVQVNVLDSTKIGMVFQNPDSQLVTDKVWHELAFGLENLGLSTAAIRNRVAEVSSYLGISSWLDLPVANLSGGQKQLCNLGSVLAMGPEVLLLDEPTAQLDPISTGRFFNMLAKINEELGITIVMTEHHLEQALNVVDRVLVLEQGKLTVDEKPTKIEQKLKYQKSKYYEALPVCIKLWGKHAIEKEKCPLNVKETRAWIADEKININPPKTNEIKTGKPVVQCKEVSFRYERKSKEVLKQVSLQLNQGEFLGIAGPNGSGKSTFLSLLAGQYKPLEGKIKIDGQVAFIPQNPDLLFIQDTILKDFLAVAKEEKINEIANKLAITHLLQRHPYDLSGGELQLVAFAKALLLEAKVLILDECTKGMDGICKAKIGALLCDLARDGKTIIMASHDLEFCQEFCSKMVLCFEGEFVSFNDTATFFWENLYYTTDLVRVLR